MAEVGWEVLVSPSETKVLSFPPLEPCLPPGKGAPPSSLISLTFKHPPGCPLTCPFLRGLFGLDCQQIKSPAY